MKKTHALLCQLPWLMVQENGIINSTNKTITNKLFYLTMLVFYSHQSKL